MSHTTILIHYVFRTKHSEPTINPDFERDLYAYIHGICKNSKLKLIRINGMPEHVHMLVDIGANISVADAIKLIKQHSSTWMKSQVGFKSFKGWSEGYFAETVSVSAKNDVIEYIKNQKSHHISNSFYQEMMKCYMNNNREDELKYFFKD